jgi:ElaB/YqjD/DUF883 family membrane-anchored ribosome-binding protein
MSGSATDPGNRSSAEIERDVERTRARLSGTLDELRDRAQPGQLFEQVLDYAKQSGGADMARNLGQQMRDNPLPLLLIGAGIGWLMMGGGSKDRANGMASAPIATPRHIPATGPWPRDERSHGDGTSIADRASSAASAAKDQVSDAASSLRDSVAGAVESAGDAIGHAYGRVSDAAGSVVDGAADSARQLRDRAAFMGDDARRGMRNGMGWLVSEQPLVLGALGLAVGAAVGALLPGTETEDRLMGETRDRLVGQARETAEQGYERVKETAGEHVEQAKQRLNEAGLSPDRMGAALSDTARQLKDAVTDVAKDAAGQAKGAIEGDGNPPPAPSAGSPPARPGMA